MLPIELQRCSAPSPRSAVSKHYDTEVASVACPEVLYSVLKRTWDVALNWPFSGMDPKAKTAKTWKPWLFVGLVQSFVPLLLPLEKGDVGPPKLPVQTLHGICEINWWKEEWGLCWVCSSPVLVIDLSMIVSKNYCLPHAVCITWCEAANGYNLIYCICNFLSNMRSCYLFLSWPVLLTFYHGRWFQRSNKTLPT